MHCAGRRDGWDRARSSPWHMSRKLTRCLRAANIQTLEDLVTKTEAEMLKYRNFGKKSLNEIKDKLTALGLSLGMNIDAALLEAAKEEIKL